MTENHKPNDRIQALEQQIARLQETLQQKEKVDVYIEIHHLNLEHFDLADLSFRLDSLDIKELSGTLNLGNNFSRPSHQENVKKNNDEKSDGTIVLFDNKHIPHTWKK
ncbi:hypothetical protein LGQ02_04080 [Bacillus shivajii]|uniref:hypothetical protein n=1 Tax=Bacillus shivajii TaxID=1983719 RepID=UPI001CF9FEDF|nr:hypothetical protein [Bacillus shivajii]UCZ53970.1 hypothetical protein LGQ02_04080 [Bacillus shivajii]